MSFKKDSFKIEKKSLFSNWNFFLKLSFYIFMDVHIFMMMMMMMRMEMVMMMMMRSYLVLTEIALCLYSGLKFSSNPYSAPTNSFFLITTFSFFIIFPFYYNFMLFYFF